MTHSQNSEGEDFTVPEGEEANEGMGGFAWIFLIVIIGCTLAGLR